MCKGCLLTLVCYIATVDLNKGGFIKIHKEGCYGKFSVESPFYNCTRGTVNFILKAFCATDTEFSRIFYNNLKLEIIVQVMPVLFNVICEL